ncbi:MAG: class I SAM-dependent methyltransferase [Planctomycetes bacterium]|nr:class I SAM-dependent methyltransferase [Planctomycetota bacterium]
MIEFEDYQETSKCYDQTRTPIGIEILLGCLASTPRPLSEHRILDAGCGTGNYIQALKGKVGCLCGLEFNEGMLAQAQEKFRKDSSVSLEQGSLLEPLKYDTNTFDGIICNQVLHHLVTESCSEDSSPIQQLIEEAHRVLRPGGVFVINNCGHKQLCDGFWWADLIPDAMGRMAKRVPTTESLVSALKNIGFRMGGLVVPVDAVLQGDKYLDPTGPLHKSFRDGDSTWSLTTPEELERAIERTKTMNRDGSMAMYLDSREDLRKHIGQTTFVFAYKL